MIKRLSQNFCEKWRVDREWRKGQRKNLLPTDYKRIEKKDRQKTEFEFYEKVLGKIHEERKHQKLRKKWLLWKSGCLVPTTLPMEIPQQQSPSHPRHHQYDCCDGGLGFVNIGFPKK